MSEANGKVEMGSFENGEDLWHVVGGVTETWKSQCSATGKQLTSTCRIMCELDFAYIGQLLVKVGFAGVTYSPEKGVQDAALAALKP